MSDKFEWTHPITGAPDNSHYKNELAYLKLIHAHTEEELSRSKDVNKLLTGFVHGVDELLRDLWRVDEEHNK